MRPLTFITFSLLAACGNDPGTSASATDSATGTTNPGTSSTATTGDPLTSTTGDPTPTTSGVSESATGTTTDASTTSSSGPDTTATTGPVATDGSSSSTTGDADSSSSTTGDAESSSSSGDESTTTGDFQDCATLQPAFAAETLKIRSCTDSAECGQDLKQTSCGCTRNWVARTDADTTHFYELLAKGQELECELIGPSTCDCPNAEGFACKQNICTWNYL